MIRSIIGSVASSISSYTPTAKTFFAQLTTAPSSFMKSLYNTLFINDAANIASSDTYYVNWVEHEDNTLVNLANPGTYTKTAVGAPVFNKHIGVQSFNGVDGAYNWNFIPSSNGVKFGLNDCCLWVWLQSDRVLTIPNILGCANVGETGSIRLFPYNFPPKTVYGTTDPFKNGSSQAVYTDLQIQDLWSFTWNGVSFKLYHNGVLKETVAGSTALSAVTFSFHELAQNLAGTLSTRYSANIGAIGVGKSTMNQLNLYNNLKTFNDALPVWSFYGDSITSGYIDGASMPFTYISRADRWPTLLSVNKGFEPFNQGVPSATIASFLASGVQIRKPSNTNQRIFLSYGVNDSANGVGYVPTYKANYQTLIDMVKAVGWTNTQIVIVAGEYVVGPNIDVTNYVNNFIPAAQEIAANNTGIQQFNCYPLAYALTQSPAIGHGLHPTAAGCVTKANYLIANVQ